MSLFSSLIDLGSGATRASLGEQIRRIAPLLGAVYAAAATLLGGAVLAWQIKGINVGTFTRDPANIHNAPFYEGALSNLGVLCWCTAAVVCLLTASVLNEPLKAYGRRTFLLVSGLFTLVLLVDDLYLLHEKVFPGYLHIPQNSLYAFHVGMLLACLITFRKVIAGTDYLILLASAAFLGTGMFADAFTDGFQDTSLKFLCEDGPKFFGIVSWATYYTRLGYLTLAEGRPRAASAAEAVTAASRSPRPD